MLQESPSNYWVTDQTRRHSAGNITPSSVFSRFVRLKLAQGIWQWLLRLNLLKVQILLKAVTSLFDEFPQAAECTCYCTKWFWSASFIYSTQSMMDTPLLTEKSMSCRVPEESSRDCSMGTACILTATRTFRKSAPSKLHELLEVHGPDPQLCNQHSYIHLEGFLQLEDGQGHGRE